MRTLPKMTMEECCIPTGNECLFPSQRDAEAFSARLPVGNDCYYTRLMLLTSAKNENYFCWCSFDDADQIRVFYPIFKNDTLREDRIINEFPAKGRPLQEGEYLKYENKFYIICIDEYLGTVIKQIAVFSTALDACAVWHMGTLTPQTADEDEPDCYLVQISKVSSPNTPVCVCWYIRPKEDATRIHPVFIEDKEKISAIPPCDINWNYLKEGDIFRHGNKMYQVCLDEREDYYIAPTLLQICAQNP